MSNYNELKLTYQGGSQETITLTGDTIGFGEYQRRDIVAVEVPEIVERIEDYAFCDNNNLSSITLSEGLVRIGGQAFQHGVYTAVTIPSTVTEIGYNSFNTIDEQVEDYHTFTITCLATIPPMLDDPEGITFGDHDFITAIYVPAESVSAYQQDWPAYASKIQAAPADDILTNLDIKAAYVGTDEVVKMYMGSDVVWVYEEPDPCEEYEQGTQERCECEGRYWWDDECHDEPEPDPMLTTPLTFEITSVGTAATGSIGLRLSGDTSAANKRPVTYYLTHEGTETSGNLTFGEAASNSAITSLITGLTVGDKIEFWGYTDQSGLSVSESAYEYFVTTAGVTVKVYGNVNSFLFSGNYHGQPVPEVAEAAAYAFYKLFENKSGFTFGAPAELQHIVLPVPANGLQDSIYREMFFNCTGMTTPPILPATTLAAGCYRSMFNGAGLTTAPELPATTMADYAYLSMFADCPITQAPVLPATTLATNCYRQMFRNTNITDMPDLPATTLQEYCYEGMFSACTSLTGVTAELPATTLAGSCYSGMFHGCTPLTTAPSLPATTLANNCYYEMFRGCSSLTAAPELPATTLADNCYYGMFNGCASLTTAPELPATTLAGSCYDDMFKGCSGLTTAPALPATTLAGSCYEGMFSGCTSLTTAPELPATTLATSCYRYMFQGCTSLTTAPELPATTMADTCYSYMFANCTSLNYIKVLLRAPRFATQTACNNWVNGVASTGTFVKAASMTGWSRGTSGIPEGWTVEDAVIAENNE